MLWQILCPASGKCKFFGIVYLGNQFIGGFSRTVWLSVIKISNDIGINSQKPPEEGDFKYPSIWHSFGFVTDNPVQTTDSITLEWFDDLVVIFNKFAKSFLRDLFSCLWEKGKSGKLTEALLGEIHLTALLVILAKFTRHLFPSFWLQETKEDFCTLKTR